MKTLQSMPFLIISGFLLSACDLIDPKNTNDKIELPNITSAQLKQVQSNTEFETYLKNGLRFSNKRASENRFINVEDGIAVDQISSRGETASTAENNASFSTTNTQETGVDEADRIEYDGQYLYLLTESNNFYYLDTPIALSANRRDTSPEAISGDASADVLPASIIAPQKPSPAGIRVMQRGEDASMNEIAWPKIEGVNNFNGLYLNKDVLAAVSSSYGPVRTMNIQNDFWYWGQPKTRLDLFDVSTPAEININQTLLIDGQFISSRRIDNKLILITQFTPQLQDFRPYPSSEDDFSNNSTLINNARIEDLLPNISINGEKQPLLKAVNCYIPSDSDEKVGYANLMIISIIDMSSPRQFKSSCFNAISQGIYVSPKSLYITSSNGEKNSKIHKFTLDTDVALYAGSGSIPGFLGWRSPSFRMSEAGDNLRVVSSTRNATGEREHFLTILQDDKQGKLIQISQLPNDIETAKIGKPNEDIQAVRYFGDRAYIVTFLQTDPLYVIDVSDATSPKILGDLEIPGFSSYLHPITNNLILGFGQDTWADTKMSLFDVSNPSKPIELKNFIWKNTSTPLRWDSRALAFLQTADNSYRFAFPTQSWLDSSSDAELFMFDLNITDKEINLTESKPLSITSNNERGYAYGYNQRSVIQGDEVHFIYDYRVWSANWDLSVINNAQ